MNPFAECRITNVCLRWMEVKIKEAAPILTFVAPDICLLFYSEYKLGMSKCNITWKVALVGEEYSKNTLQIVEHMSNIDKLRICLHIKRILAFMYSLFYMSSICNYWAINSFHSMLSSSLFIEAMNSDPNTLCSVRLVVPPSNLVVVVAELINIKLLVTRPYLRMWKIFWFWLQQLLIWMLETFTFVAWEQNIVMKCLFTHSN